MNNEFTSHGIKNLGKKVKEKNFANTMIIIIGN